MKRIIIAISAIMSFTILSCSKEESSNTNNTITNSTVNEPYAGHPIVGIWESMYYYITNSDGSKDTHDLSLIEWKYRYSSNGVYESNPFDIDDGWIGTFTVGDSTLNHTYKEEVNGPQYTNNGIYKVIGDTLKYRSLTYNGENRTEIRTDILHRKQ